MFCFCFCFLVKGGEISGHKLMIRCNHKLETVKQERLIFAPKYELLMSDVQMYSFLPPLDPIPLFMGQNKLFWLFLYTWAFLFPKFKRAFFIFSGVNSTQTRFSIQVHMSLTFFFSFFMKFIYFLIFIRKHMNNMVFEILDIIIKYIS